MERVGGLAMAESSGNTEVVRCVVVQIGGAVGEQYGVRRGYDCTSVKRIKKKAPPGQTLFSNFLFSGPEFRISKFFSPAPSNGNPLVLVYYFQSNSESGQWP